MVWDNILSMNRKFLEEPTPKEIQQQIAIRIRAVRKRKKLSQVKLSEKSGVSLGSVKRFETSGEISLGGLIKLAIALDMVDEFEALFAEIPYATIEEVIYGQN